MAVAFALKVRLPLVVKRLLDSPRLTALFRPDYPPLAVEVTSRAISGVVIERIGGGGIALSARAVVPLPPGLVQPSLLKPAIIDLDVFKAALAQCLKQLPSGNRQISILLPDRVGKISFVELEKSGSTLSETADLIRWKLKRGTPFRVEDGRIGFQAFAAGGGAKRFLVSMVLTQVVEQFERAVADVGYSCGLVDLASFNLWNLVHDRLGRNEDSLIVNVGDEYATAIIARGAEPLMVRCKSPAGPEPPAAEEIRAELNSSLLYYQDRIGGPGIAQALVRAPEAFVPIVSEALALHGIRAVPVDLGGIAGGSDLLPSEIFALAPAVGAACGR
jgi:hypothetical protein